MRYQVCGLVVESNLPLFEQSGGIHAQPDCFFRLLPPALPEDLHLDWFHEWTLEDGSAWLLFARSTDGYLLRFPELADFRVAHDGSAITCAPLPGVPLETIRHLLLDQVFPLVCSRLGRLALHASAVATPAGAIAFVGSTGMGKSTLAASLAQRGFPLLTDDCLVLEHHDERLLGLPHYPGVRLWEDSRTTLFSANRKAEPVAHYTSKRRVLFDHEGTSFSDSPVPIARIYFLAPAEDTQQAQATIITPMPPSAALVELVRYSFKLDIGDQALLRDEFLRLSRIATLPLLYQLSFRHDYALLPAVHNAVLAPLGLR